MKPHEHVILEVAQERERQMAEEGYRPRGDDENNARGELAQAAGCYAVHAGQPPRAQVPAGIAPCDWPWAPTWWKPRDPRRDLIRAAALIVAEIERIDRATGKV